MTAAIIYDFIPLDRPGYLQQVSARIDYFAKLAHLRQFDLFLPISEYSAQRLTEVLGIDSDSIKVTGAPIRREIFAEVERSRRENVERTPYFLCVGGGDRRKNTEVAVQAVWRLRLMVGDQVRLKVVGHYGEDYRRGLLALASAAGTNPSFLEFCTGVDDAALVGLYCGAIATIAPSHIEGFSMPVVEAAACGTPVVASMCAAHLELIDQPEALFSSDSVEELTSRLLAVWEDGELRESLVRAQAPMAPRFHENAVAGRFWDFILGHADSRLGPSGPMPLRNVRPRLAFLTPYPPEQSGVARFSELTLRSLGRRADVDLYTDAARPLNIPENVCDAGPVSHAVMRRGPYDSVISVLGNSHFHIPMFAIMEKFGGPCILHDSRLAHIYRWRLGDEGFREWASGILRRPVSEEEVRNWMEDRQPPSLFLEPVIARSEPLIVHTRRFRDLLRERYGIDACVATFPPNNEFLDEELLPESRAQARSRLDIADGVFAVGTFGYVLWTKGITPLLVAAELLRSWNIPAELFIVGNSKHIRSHIEHIAREYGNADHVHIFDYVGDKEYRDYLLAVDAGVQLRTYDYGQPSAALADCIAAGLPVVSNDSLADSCSAPFYVSCVHDHISPLLVAEQLAEIWERRPRDCPRLQTERRRYCEDHNFDRYAARLLDALGFQ
jgi:glycosyltransferase involved in cell wall biosynthesis